MSSTDISTAERPRSHITLAEISPGHSSREILREIELNPEQFREVLNTL